MIYDDRLRTANFQTFSFENFFITMVDIFLLPFGFLSLMSPIRIVNFFQALSMKTLRNHVFLIGVRALLDYVTLPFALLSLISPLGRQITFCRMFAYHFHVSLHIEKEYSELESGDDECCCGFPALSSLYHRSALHTGCYTILEWILVLFGSTVLFVPTVWPTFYDGKGRYSRLCNVLLQIFICVHLLSNYFVGFLKHYQLAPLLPTENMDSAKVWINYLRDSIDWRALIMDHIIFQIIHAFMVPPYNLCISD